MKHSEIIRKAMKTLAITKEEQLGDQSPHICDNLSRVSRIYYDIDPDLDDKVKEIKSLINERLHGYFSLNSLNRWLVIVHGVDQSEIAKYSGNGVIYFTKEFQQYRLAWMEQLAQEYEAKGM